MRCGEAGVPEIVSSDKRGLPSAPAPMPFIDTPGGHEVAHTVASNMEEAANEAVHASDFSRCWWATPNFMLQARVG